MSWRASTWWFLLALIGLHTAAGQGIRPPFGRPPGTPQTEPFAATGIVQRVLPGRVQILTNTNQTWIVLIDPKAVVHVQGTAKADYLRPGQYVRFMAAVDKKGRVVDKLASLTLFTPRAPTELGIWPEGTAGEQQAGQPQQFGAGAAPSNPAAGDAQRYMVAGRIASLRRGTMAVNTGRVLIQAELAEDPKIEVDVANYLLAKPGDKISVTKGRMPAGLMALPPGRIGTAQATELTIELTQPLTTQPAKPARPPRQPPPEGPQAAGQHAQPGT